MTRTADCPLDRAPWARGGAGSGVVDSGSALYPTTVRALSLPSTCGSLKAAPGGGGWRAGGWEWGEGEKGGRGVGRGE